MLDSLLISMETLIFDDLERMRMYPLVLSNYAKFLGLMGANNDALALAVKGNDLCVKYGELDMISTFTGTRAWNLHKLGRKEEAIPLLAQSFYTSGAVGKIGNQEANRRYAMEKFGIVFP